MPGRIDPFLSKNFRVEIDGVAASSFSEALGLEASIDVVEYRAGDDPADSVRKIPGLSKVGDVTLKRGITEDRSLWAWFHNNQTGVLDRRSVAIVLLNQTDEPVLRWALSNAWPRKWSGPALNAECSDVAIETVVLAYEGLSLSE